MYPEIEKLMLLEFQI